MEKINETDIQNREKAIALLEKMKAREKKKGLIPLHIKDRDNTILLISPRLNPKQREKLKEQKLAESNRRHSLVMEKEM